MVFEFLKLFDKNYISRAFIDFLMALFETALISPAQAQNQF